MTSASRRKSVQANQILGFSSDTRLQWFGKWLGKEAQSLAGKRVGNQVDMPEGIKVAGPKAQLV